MNKDWVQTTKDMSAALKQLRGGAPAVMHGFSAIAQAALKANALDTKTKELIALAIAVATRCDGCIAFHAEAAGAIDHHLAGVGQREGRRERLQQPQEGGFARVRHQRGRSR